MSEITIITNNVPRFTVEAYELSSDERAEFDYLDWSAIDAGMDSADFLRYRGTTYDLGEFQRAPEALPGWDGCKPETFFSGILVRYVDSETVVCGRYYS